MEGDIYTTRHGHLEGQPGRGTTPSRSVATVDLLKLFAVFALLSGFWKRESNRFCYIEKVLGSVILRLEVLFLRNLRHVYYEG